MLWVLVIVHALPLRATIHRVPGDYASIQEAIDASVNTDTVLVGQNTYFENIDFKGKNIVVGSLYVTTRDSSHVSRTIIDGQENGPVVTLKSNEDPTARLVGFTIRNGKSDYGGGIWSKSASPTIAHCIIRDNTAEATNPMGAGIYMSNSHSKIYHCEIMHNSAIGTNTSNGWGGGIAATQSGTIMIVNCKIHHNQSTSCYGGIGLANSQAKIIGCEITNNLSYSGGSGIGFQDSDVMIVNSTIALNRAASRNNAVYFIRSSPVLHNCIIWHNSDQYGNSNLYGFDGTPVIFFSNIQGGYDTLSVMQLEPVFSDTSSGDFRLAYGSPCIDAGDPDTLDLNLPLCDLDGNSRLTDGNNDGMAVVDMGAYESGSQPTHSDHKMAFYHPTACQLHQNYPNPFNSSTQISYYLPAALEVRLTITNMLGETIITLIDDRQAMGHHSVHWSGTDFRNGKVPSGLYFYQLRAGSDVLNGKLIVLE